MSILKPDSTRATRGDLESKIRYLKNCIRGYKTFKTLENGYNENCKKWCKVEI
jgi:hypothetical protein